MLSPTNNYDFSTEASIARCVHDPDGKPINTKVEENYTRDIGRCCQKTVKVLTSTVGTLILLCFYLAAGAWMFQYLEKGNELEACFSKYEKYIAKLNTSVLRVTGIVDSGLPKEVVEMQLEEALTDFAETLFALDFPPSRNCTVILEPLGSKWNWVSALYFCATIITTIGYGHVAPATQWGRLVCIFYCILGIPLLLIYLGSIGQMLAYLFRFTYMNICCCRCFRDIWLRRRQRRQLRLERLQQDLRRHMEMRAKLTGEPIPPPKLKPIVLEDDSDEDEEIREIYQDFQDTEDAGIPITIVMLVIAGYVTMGAFIFRIWETDWTPIDGAYFAIITISTIGFGDLVLGNGRFDKPETISELLIGALYCIVGLALLSMCFELMKEEFVDKIRWIGRSLRIVDSGSAGELDNVADEIQGSGFDGENEFHNPTSYTFATFSGDNDMADTCGNAMSISNSSHMRKSVCVLRSHPKHISVRSRGSVKQRSQMKKSEKLFEGEDDIGMDGDMEDMGEDNEAFGEDMTMEGNAGDDIGGGADMEKKE